MKNPYEIQSLFGWQIAVLSGMNHFENLHRGFCYFYTISEIN